MSQFLNQSAFIANRFKIDDATPFAIASGGTFTLTGLPSNGESVTIGTKTYTWVTVINNGANGEVLISGTPILSIGNMIEAIVLGFGAGTLYSTATTLHPDAKAVLGTGDSMDITARRQGADGNLILTDTVANGSWNQPTLTGGTSPETWLNLIKGFRVPYLRDPTLEFDIFGADDWPDLILAPDGQMRAPLVEGAIYKVHNTHVIPLMLWPKATSFLTFAPTEITGARLAVSLLVFGTPGIPHIWGREVGVAAMNRVSAVDITNGGLGGTSTLFDLTGGTAFSSWLTNLFAPIQFKKMGSLVDIGINCSNSAWSNNNQGLVQRFNPGNALFNQCETLVVNGLFGPAMTKPFHAILGAPVVMIQLGNPVELKSGDPLYYVDSAVPDLSNLVFSSHPYSGPATGNFFRPDYSGSITAMAQVDYVVDSFSDSVVNPGVDTTVNLAAITKFTKGQEVLLADEAAYDGLRTIVRIADDQLSFDINVVFSTSGAGTIKSTRFTASADHPMVEGETNIIAGTTAYNGTLINLLVDDTTFDRPVAFVTDEATGTVTSTSKNSKSIGVLSIGNGAQPDSMVLSQANLSVQQTVIITTASATILSMAAGAAGVTIVTTSAAHGFANESGVEITGSSAPYNDNTYLIFDASGSVFSIMETFVATATGTASQGQGISQPVPGTSWTQDIATERFVVGTDGRSLYEGLAPFTGLFSYNATVSKSGGGADIIEGSLFINGKKDDRTISVTQNATPTQISKEVIKEFNTDDFFDIGLTNNSGTSNIVVEAQAQALASRSG